MIEKVSVHGLLILKMSLIIFFFARKWNDSASMKKSSK